MPVPPPPVGLFDATFQGDSLNNEIAGTLGSDLIYGGAGNDALSGRRGRDYIDGGAGDDVIAGGRDTDTLIGGTGNDVLTSGAGADLMFGGDGNDTLLAEMDAGSGQVMYGGVGSDLFRLVQPQTGFSVQIGDFSFAEDQLTINGQALATLVTAGVGVTALPDGGFSVFLPALGGTVILSGTTTQSLVQAVNLAGADVFAGSAGADYFDGEAGNDQIDGGDGNDELGGGDGNDVISGGHGNDTIGGDRGNDTLLGGDGNDEIYGRFGSNLIDGGTGDDLLSTGRDSSTVIGGEGDDYISARLEVGGDHLLTGGAGADTFDFFGSRAGRISDSVITDFDVSEDQFTINGIDGFAYADDFNLNFVDTSAGAVVTLQTGSTITFQGVSVADLTDLIS